MKASTSRKEPLDRLAIDLEHVPFTLDEGIGRRANLGLVVLRTDQTIEDEFRRLLPKEGVALYGARIHNDTDIRPDTLLEMRDRIAPTTELLPPGVDFDVIGFACTSGAMAIGEAEVAVQVRRARPEVQVTDPVTAARAAFDKFGVRRIGLVTPYSRTINMGMCERFEARGLEVGAMGSFNEPDDNRAARIAERSIFDLAVAVGRSSECEGVFVSCTSLRLIKIVQEIEAVIGKPVTSSNHALAWHMLRLAAIEDRSREFGRLFFDH